MWTITLVKDVEATDNYCHHVIEKPIESAIKLSLEVPGFPVVVSIFGQHRAVITDGEVTQDIPLLFKRFADRTFNEKLRAIIWVNYLPCVSADARCEKSYSTWKLGEVETAFFNIYKEQPHDAACAIID